MNNGHEPGSRDRAVKHSMGNAQRTSKAAFRAKPALWTLAGLAAALAVAVILVIGPWLLTRGQQDNLTAEQELSARNDVRTTLIQAVGGLALAGGLVLTYRTYLLNRSTNVTEVYTNAVEQLGHEKAPVRLGAIHALAHLGQDNPARRQTVIDVLCAYLRLPYEPPAADAAPSAAHEESEVRQTAQRSLATHLCTPDRTTNGTTGSRKPLPQEVFWPDMNIDLTNASLYDVHFDDLSVADATFEGATFAGNPNYSGNTTFVGATFNGEANFYQTTFDRGAFFDRATFTGDAVFTGRPSPRAPDSATRRSRKMPASTAQPSAGPGSPARRSPTPRGSWQRSPARRASTMQDSSAAHSSPGPPSTGAPTSPTRPSRGLLLQRRNRGPTEQPRTPSNPNMAGRLDHPHRHRHPGHRPTRAGCGWHQVRQRKLRARVLDCKRL